MKTKTLMECGLFTALTVIGAWIRIPLPYIPITLQTPTVLLCGLLLDKKYAALPPLIYLLLGLAGFPVFTGGGGIGYLLKPTFGYLLGFVAAGFVTAALSAKRTFGRLLFAAFCGLFCIYLCGSLYYFFLTARFLGGSTTLSALLATCVFATLPTDILLTFLTVSIAKRFRRR